jgi:hypothetical protein
VSGQSLDLTTVVRMLCCRVLAENKYEWSDGRIKQLIPLLILPRMSMLSSLGPRGGGRWDFLAGWVQLYSYASIQNHRA